MVTPVVLPATPCQQGSCENLVSEVLHVRHGHFTAQVSCLDCGAVFSAYGRQVEGVNHKDSE